MAHHFHVLRSFVWKLCFFLIYGATRVSAKAFLDSEPINLTDTPAILDSLYQHDELANLLRHCFDKSHRYSLEGAHNRLSPSFPNTSVVELEDSSGRANYSQPYCMLRHVSGKKQLKECNDFKNNSWFEILKEEFDGFNFLNSARAKSTEKDFLARVCSSWTRLLALKGFGLVDEYDEENFETETFVLPKLLEINLEDYFTPEGISDSKIRSTGVEKMPVDLVRTKRYAVRNNIDRQILAQEFNDSNIDMISIFASFVALGLAFLLQAINSAVGTPGPTGPPGSPGSSVRTGAISINANSPNYAYIYVDV